MNIFTLTRSKAEKFCKVSTAMRQVRAGRRLIKLAKLDRNLRLDFAARAQSVLISATVRGFLKALEEEHGDKLQVYENSDTSLRKRSTEMLPYLHEGAALTANTILNTKALIVLSN